MVRAVTEHEGRCGSCAAFTRVRVDPAHGKIGECALEVFPPPLAAGSTCSRYRPKGAAAPPPRPRAAGEPRRGAARASPLRGGPQAGPAAERPPLPEEIDIDMDIEEFRRVLRDVLADELGISQAPMAPRWQGGELVLVPGKAGTQEKRVPLDNFFHKIVMIRDKLRVLEQRINGHEGLAAADKIQLQQYITACYGSLTTFNLLFAEREDAFAGSSKE